MARFHKLKIVDVRRETSDCVSIAFEVPVNLADEFKYIQGQYLTLKLNIAGEEIRRSYSACSSPVIDSELRIAVKEVKDGKGSTYLNRRLKSGDTLEVMTPMGNFHTPVNPSHSKHYVLFAGGSGITPMLSIIKTILHSEPKSTLLLFYGNQDEKSTIFKEQIDQLAILNPDRFKLHYIFDRPENKLWEEIFTGIMSPEKITRLIDRFVQLKPDNEYFICGPSGMMESVKQSLNHLNVESSKIHIEYFTAVLDAAKKIDQEEIERLPRMDSKVTVILDGEETEITLATDGESILDAALNADVDVPFACKGAVCCTCRAKLVEGKVRMDMNYALSESEVEDGYILTCQSHPLTPVVVVDYDQN